MRRGSAAMTPLSPDGSAVPPTRGGRSPYTGGTVSLHGANAFPTRSKRFPCAGAEGKVQLVREPRNTRHGVGPLWWGGEWWSSLGYAITCGMRQPRNFATDRCCHLVSRIANRAFYLSAEAGGWRTTFLRFSPKGQGGRSRFAACSGLPVRTTSRRSTLRRCARRATLRRLAG